MQLSDLIQGIAGFPSRSHAEKVKFFAWYLHSGKSKARVTQAEIRACYDELHLERPSNVSSYFDQLAKKTPSELLHDRQGYYLSRHVRDELDRRYGRRATTIQVDQLLAELPGKISSEAEQVFLSEALTCFRHGAFRATIVMTWNLAYYHLEEWLMKNHLAQFNTQIPISFPKHPLRAITKQDDFANLKESEVIDICRAANLISADVKKILREKLDRRNTAAHPSLIHISRLQAEEFIFDLVNNAVLKLV